MKNVSLIVALLLASAATAWSEGAVVQFVDGTIELQRGERWERLEAGDEAAADATVRLREGYAELSRANAVVTLSRPGVYRLAEVFRASDAVSAWNIGSVLGTKLGALGGGRRSTDSQAASMGVRAEAREGGAVTWVEDESAEARARALDLMSESRYQEAAVVLRDALDLAVNDQERAELRFYAAYAEDSQGNHGEALRLLAETRPDSAAPYYGDYALLKGRLLVESLAPDDALAVVDAYLEAYPGGENAQAALVLTSYAFRAMGDRQAAAARLERARALAPSSEMARTASRLLAELAGGR